MSIRKTLTGIVLAGALALGSTGCGGKDYSMYCYNGKIGEDQVTFTQRRYIYLPSDNILTVTKPDGRIIKYGDKFKDDLKLDYVQITKGGLTTEYTHDEIGKPVLEEAQKQFDIYLQKIKETKIRDAQKIKENKIREGLENLK